MPSAYVGARRAPSPDAGLTTVALLACAVGLLAGAVAFGALRPAAGDPETSVLWIRGLAFACFTAGTVAALTVAHVGVVIGLRVVRLLSARPAGPKPAQRVVPLNKL